MNKSLLRPVALGLALWSMALLLVAPPASAVSAESATEEVEVEKGPHRGRLLKQDGFVVELSIFETGVPPEFRVWITQEGKRVSPESVSLTVNLIRLGDVVDTINFKPQSDFLRGDMEIYEPHSFVVSINASHQNKSYHWQYDNFEGRTKIEAQVAAAMNIETGVAGEATLSETIEVFGRIVPAQDAQRHITARFDGAIKSMPASLGETVKIGDLLATVESNESLKSYRITSPINGVVSAKNTNVGEQTDGRVLLTITNLQKLTAELSVFPANRASVVSGAPAKIYVAGHKVSQTNTVNTIDSHLQSNQSTVARVNLDNSTGRYFPGQFVTGTIEVDRYKVPLAVKRTGLQSFRDFTVVYAKVGDEYEVRMLELGRTAGEWVEVLSGLAHGTEYVTENSFIIKADIEKSGASHDH